MLLAESPDVVRYPVDDDRDRQERPANHHAERKDVQRKFVHQRGLWIGRGFRALPGDGCAAVEVGRDTGQDHQRNRYRSHGRAAEFRVGRKAVLLGDRRADRRAEQIGVQEVPYVIGIEEVVAQRPVLLHGQAQSPEARLCPVEGHQDVIEPEEHRDLRQHWQAAQDRIEAVLALEFLHLQRHPLTVFAVLLLQRLDLGLQFLHLPGGAYLPDKRLIKKRAQAEDEEHHRQRPREEVVGSEDQGEELVPEPHDSRHRVVDVVQAEPVKHGCC